MLCLIQRLDYIVVDSALWDLLVKEFLSSAFHYVQSVNLHKEGINLMPKAKAFLPCWQFSTQH